MCANALGGQQKVAADYKNGTKIVLRLPNPGKVAEIAQLLGALIKS